MTVTRRFALALATASLALLGGAGLAAAAPAKITILQVNDWDLMDGTKDKGGFSRLLTILEKENAAAPEVLLLHAGDALSPSLLSGFDKGAHMIELLNRLPLDGFVMGNHEFDFGPDNARTQLGKAEFPIFNANVKEPDGKSFAGLPASKIIEVAGYKLGIFGVTTPDTIVLATTGDVKFEPVVETAASVAKQLRADGADLVIALVHIDHADDAKLRDLGTIDLVVSGHDQDLEVLYDGKTVLTESYAQADYVTAIDLELDRVKQNDKEKVVWRPSFRVLDSALYEPSVEGKAIIKTYEDKLSKELDIEIGKTEVDLDSRRATVRTQEATIGNLIADATRAAVDADVGFANGGGIRGDKTYTAGQTLLRRDIQTELPFGNRTVKLEVTGAQLLAALENGFSQFEANAGRFPQLSGVAVSFDPARPPGARVVKVEVNGAPLDPAKTYTVATNDYMASGGDGYTSFGAAKVLIDAASAQFMASQVIDYIAAKGAVAPKIEGRITRLN